MKKRFTSCALLGVILYHGYTLQTIPWRHIGSWVVASRVWTICPPSGPCEYADEALTVKQAKQAVDWEIHWRRVENQYKR